MRRHQTRKERSKAIKEAMIRLAMESDDFRLASSRFQMCLARQIGSAGMVGDADPAAYCKLVICEPCQSARFSEEHSDLLARISAKLRQGFKGTVISVTLSSPISSLHAAESIVDRMLRAWSRFSDRKGFQSVAEGYARTVRLEVDIQADAAACHTSILMLAVRTHRLQTSQDWHLAWARNAGCEADRVTHFNVVSAAAPTALGQISAETQRITRIGIDPGELCEFVDTKPTCDPRKLKQIMRALRGRKLIRACRDLATID